MAKAGQIINADEGAPLLTGVDPEGTARHLKVTEDGGLDGVVVGKTAIVDVTLSLDTDPYGASDVLAATQVVSNAVRIADMGGVLESLTLIDKDDQGAALDIWIMDADVAMGTENAAPSMSDGDAASILGRISIGTGDYVDLSGVKVAAIKGIDLPIKPAAGTRDIYIAALNGAGTPTYSASGLVVRLGIRQD